MDGPDPEKRAQPANSIALKVLFLQCHEIDRIGDRPRFSATAC